MDVQATEAASRNIYQAREKVREQSERSEREAAEREASAEAAEQKEKLDEETSGAQAVSKNLDHMNENSSGETDSDYDFQNSVLSAAYSGKGTIMDRLI